MSHRSLVMGHTLGFTPLEIAKSHGQDKIYGKKLEQRKSLTGFTLLEVLIVMTLLAILGGLAAGSYRNYAKSVEFKNAGKSIIFDLKKMQGRAMAGQDQLKWGIRFANGASDTYETFSTPTTYADAAKATVDTTYLSSTIVFTTPAEGVNLDIIFDRIKGTTSANTVTIASEGKSTTVTVTSQGNIY